ncbi:MAG TPA: hypothetical protein VNK52_16160 [Hyphomicrobiaceae bacterium]|nr:hypothetical protein [Hyphomicrobiaceae bacterium]
MMTGLATIIATVGGWIGGAMPDVLRAVLGHFDHRREVELRRLDAEAKAAELQAARELAAAEAQGKAAVEYWRMMAEQVRADRAAFAAALKAQSAPTGFTWIDTLNAAVRPVSAVTTLLVFFAVVVSVAVSGTTPEFAQQMTGLFGLLVELVVGWFFGYRCYTARASNEPYFPSAARIGAAVAGYVEGGLARSPRA